MYGYRKIRCAIWRGGTSKGIMFLEEDLPFDPDLRDQTILEIVGSPDIRQINGVGGATPTTSKIAILSKSLRPDSDVNYTFGQVGITEARIDYGPNCGNVSAAVGPFALSAGLVKFEEDGMALVRIYNTNTERMIHARFPVCGNQFVPDGNTEIPGVPGTGSRVNLSFLRPDGGATGKLFPTGNLVDSIRLENGRIVDVTVVDAGNLTVLMDGEGLPDKWDSAWFNGGEGFPLAALLERVRQEVGRDLGLYGPDEEVTAETHALPKISVIHSPYTYVNRKGILVDASRLSIVARAISMGRPHPAYPVTGGTALAACSRISGTVAWRRVPVIMRDGPTVYIGHPEGISSVDTTVSQSHGAWQVDSIDTVRTARELIAGDVWARG